MSNRTLPEGQARTISFGDIIFNDKEQTIVILTRGSYEGKAIVKRNVEYIKNKAEYFKRKLQGK